MPVFFIDDLSNLMAVSRITVFLLSVEKKCFTFTEKDSSENERKEQ